MKEKRRANTRAILTTVCIVLILINIINMRNQNFKSTKFPDIQDEWLVRVDDIEYTANDLAFYIAYEEGSVEEQAVLYNPKNPNEYWNVHTNGEFIRSSAKNTCMNMAVHDFVMYSLALDRGVSLDEEEKEVAKNNATDFWDDLGEGRQPLLLISEEELEASVQMVALAEKMQKVLAEENSKSQITYAFDGMGYNELLEEHKVEINSEVWDKLSFGNITVSR